MSTRRDNTTGNVQAPIVSRTDCTVPGLKGAV